MVALPSHKPKAVPQAAPTLPIRELSMVLAQPVRKVEIAVRTDLYHVLRITTAKHETILLRSFAHHQTIDQGLRALLESLIQDAEDFVLALPYDQLRYQLAFLRVTLKTIQPSNFTLLGGISVRPAFRSTPTGQLWQTHSCLFPSNDDVFRASTFTLPSPSAPCSDNTYLLQLLSVQIFPTVFSTRLICV